MVQGRGMRLSMHRHHSLSSDEPYMRRRIHACHMKSCTDIASLPMNHTFPWQLRRGMLKSVFFCCYWHDNPELNASRGGERERGREFGGREAVVACRSFPCREQTHKLQRLGTCDRQVTGVVVNLHCEWHLNPVSATPKGQRSFSLSHTHTRSLSLPLPLPLLPLSQ